MPSNRQIAGKIVAGSVDRGGTETRAEYYIRAFTFALAAADQRGFERAREMAAQELRQFGRDPESERDVLLNCLESAIRAIPYAEAEKP